jgi:hypothetical protein
MSNDINMVVSLLQRIDTHRALDALGKLSDYPGLNEHYLILENFIESVQIIQQKTLKQVPCLLKKEP